VNWTLELVVVPVSDVDRARDFYRDKLGFSLDHDSFPIEGTRVVQLTPPGSGCSISFGTGLIDSEPGSLKGLQLVVSDITRARAQLIERGVQVSEIERLVPQDGGAFMHFNDPDGNGWTVQEIRARAAAENGGTTQ
jgi:catechol 2,3-dioxygenase-like lactoylglutathione lyase family enzyme